MVPAAPPYSARLRSCSARPCQLPGPCSAGRSPVKGLGLGITIQPHQVSKQIWLCLNPPPSPCLPASRQPAEQAARSGCCGPWGWALSSNNDAGVRGGANKPSLCTKICRKDLAASESLLCRGSLSQQLWMKAFAGTEQPLPPIPGDMGHHSQHGQALLGCPEITASPRKRDRGTCLGLTWHQGTLILKSLLLHKCFV